MTSDDCEFLRHAYLTASEGSTILDMSSLSKEDMQSYGVVFKHLDGKTTVIRTRTNDKSSRGNLSRQEVFSCSLKLTAATVINVFQRCKVSFRTKQLKHPGTL